MKRLLLLIPLLALTGCSFFNVNQAYVEADLETYNLYSPTLTAISIGDDPPQMDPTQMQAFALGLETWKKRIDAALEDE